MITNVNPDSVPLYNQMMYRTFLPFTLKEMDEETISNDIIQPGKCPHKTKLLKKCDNFPAFTSTPDPTKNPFNLFPINKHDSQENGQQRIPKNNTAVDRINTHKGNN